MIKLDPKEDCNIRVPSTIAIPIAPDIVSDQDVKTPVACLLMIWR